MMQTNKTPGIVASFYLTLLCLSFCFEMRSQDSTMYGLYYCVQPGEHGTPKIHLMPGNESVRTTRRMDGSAHKVLGKWKSNNGKLLVVEYLTLEPNEVIKLNDSLTFEVVNESLVKNNVNVFVKRISYYENGTTRYEYKENIKTEYYRNGRIKSIITFEDGKKNGLEINYNENGLAVLLGKWKKGKPRGKWNYYNALGELTEVKNYH